METFETTHEAKVKDIAQELIKLYGKRKAAKGFAFHPDNYLQAELEASFMYEDTPDQYKATLEVKADMENHSQWIDWFVEMSDLGKRKWLFALLSKRSKMVNKLLF